MRSTLFAAAVLHVVGGLFLAVDPVLVGRLGWVHGSEPLAVRAFGGFAATLGVGYGVAAMSPLKYWPVTLVGLLSNLVAAVVWVAYGRWTVAALAGLWVVPFMLILRQASDDFIGEAGAPAPDPRERAMLRAMSQDGYSLFELSQLRPTLVVFLRHAGCTFCREAVSDLARLRPQIERSGTTLAFVTMSPESEAKVFFERYGVADSPRISDPECRLYRAFELRRAAWRDMFGWSVWKRGFQAGILDGHGVGPLEGDGFRMPGVFLVHNGQVLRSFRHDGPADRPNYLKLAGCEECSRPAQAA